MRISFLGNFSVSYSSESHHANTLEAMGHEVIRLQEAEAHAESILEQAELSEMFVWIHTHGWVTPGGLSMTKVLDILKDKGIPTVTYHLDLWFGLQRQKDLENDEFYKHIQHFFVTDKLMADWFNKETPVKGHYLPAGVLEEECTMVEPRPGGKEVVFVGSKGYHPEWPYRPKLVNWLEKTYGDKFGHYSGEQEALGLKRGLHLNQLYADAKVVVGDSLCLNFDYPYYWSDRVYETMGRGGFLIMPYIKGLNKQFVDAVHLRYYEFNNFKQLHYLIDYYLSHDREREKIRKAGHEEVKNKHTYRHRWEKILHEVNKSK